MPALILVCLSLYEVALTPVASWDALGARTGWAVHYLQFDAARSAGEVFQRVHPRHPMTVVSLAKFSGYAAGQGEARIWAHCLLGGLSGSVEQW